MFYIKVVGVSRPNRLNNFETKVLRIYSAEQCRTKTIVLKKLKQFLHF